MFWEESRVCGGSVVPFEYLEIKDRGRRGMKEETYFGFSMLLPMPPPIRGMTVVGGRPVMRSRSVAIWVKLRAT